MSRRRVRLDIFATGVAMKTGVSAVAMLVSYWKAINRQLIDKFIDSNSSTFQFHPFNSKTTDSSKDDIEAFETIMKTFLISGCRASILPFRPKMTEKSTNEDFSVQVVIIYRALAKFLAITFPSASARIQPSDVRPTLSIQPIHPVDSKKEAGSADDELLGIAVSRHPSRSLYKSLKVVDICSSPSHIASRQLLMFQKTAVAPVFAVVPPATYGLSKPGQIAVLQKPGICPPMVLNPGCHEECLSDAECLTFAKCCRATCGSKCISIPCQFNHVVHDTHGNPLSCHLSTCPRGECVKTIGDDIGVCCETMEITMPPYVIPKSHCTLYRAGVEKLRRQGVDVFQPACNNRTGLFSRIQCDGSGTCWCVDVETGRPLIGTRRSNAIDQNICEGVLVENYKVFRVQLSNNACM
uniref:Thyroglobulin type-1 domain-containing protein n=1 Tax=Angiostrongylus cantonensis TaxID=6313 RepID=A0A0K0DPM9_ANGCA